MNEREQELMGAKVRDLVTGIEGIVTSVAYWMNGCVRVCVQPPTHDNKPADTVEWCDVQQVERIGDGVRPALGLEPEIVAGSAPDYPTAVGGPQKDAPRL